jgi:hypothetical protein
MMPRESVRRQTDRVDEADGKVPFPTGATRATESNHIIIKSCLLCFYYYCKSGGTDCMIS